MRIYPAEESGELKSLGSYLKNKRRSKGLSIKKVAEELRIKEKYIKAMEKDQLDQLPTQAHQKIFVKTYSEFLGVDFNKLKKSFEIKQEESVPIEEQPEQGSTFFPVLAGFIIGVICILVFLRHIPEQKSGYPAHEILALGDTAETSSLSTPGDTSLVEMMTLRLESKEDSWVQVIADKDTLFNGILHQGTAWECNAQDEFMINIARSWAVAGFVDGRLLLPFGSQGEFAQKRTT
jgi:transcriptional regulator with XRE-family HTH domain